jgi:hypothetical protein
LVLIAVLMAAAGSPAGAQKGDELDQRDSIGWKVDFKSLITIAGGEQVKLPEPKQRQDFPGFVHMVEPTTIAIRVSSLCGGCRKSIS